MSKRKKIAADARKEANKSKSFAILRNCPTSPRKMRYVVDMIRGSEVNRALDILKFTNKEAAVRVEKLLKSAIANWQRKNENERLEDNVLIVSEIKVDSGRMMKRLRTAPQGRGYRILKRSNHVTLVVDKQVADEPQSVENQNQTK
ncbi:MAG: 50S ribosomal protein L22 [Bacteroidales bacterium]|jgi:large subunit ribosomal protein L22|nr:50S ribosomal protein L22 [Bacteroidales bacterium]